MKNQKLSLYALDKKICQMIVDIEKISSDLNVESNNLFTTTEEKKEIDFLREQYAILFDGAKDLVTELFVFKQKLNEYQFNRAKTQINEVFEDLAKSKEEIAKRKEEKLKKIRNQEFRSDEVAKPETQEVSPDQALKWGQEFESKGFKDLGDIEDVEVVSQQTNQEAAQEIIETPFGDVVSKPANGISIEEANKLWADVAKH